MDYKQLGNDIVQWIKTYANNANVNSLVIGVSGGVDSGVVSTLCAMTGLSTHVVVLPCQSKITDTVRGQNHIGWLVDKFGQMENGNIRYHKFDLTSTFEAFECLTEHHVFDPLGYANTKSRLRMITLYQISACVRGLVVGTGNKVEDFGVGFYTKYGDGGVDISPIADLTKSDVRNLAKELGLLPEIINAIPTDGLWEDNRSDEDQIGASYEELEWAMQYSTEPHTMIKLSDRQEKVLSIYKAFNTKNKHKMLPIPTYKKKG